MYGLNPNKLTLYRLFLLAPAIGLVLALLLYIGGVTYPDQQPGGAPLPLIDHGGFALICALCALLMLLTALYSARRMQLTLDASKEAWQLGLDRSRAELQQARDRYMALINQNPTALIAIDERQNVVLFNLAAEQVFGYRGSEIIGKPLTQLMPERYRATHGRLVSAFRFSGPDLVQAMSREPVTALRKDGREISIEAGISRLDLPEGTLMTVTVTDVTARRAAEAALRDSEFKFRSCFQSTVVAIVVANEDGDIIEWNSGAEAMFGYSAANYIGRPLTTLVPDYLRERHLKGLRKAVVNGGVVQPGITHEMTGMRSSQDEFPMQMTLGSWKAGDRLFFSAMLLDDTLRKKAEEQLLRQELYDGLTGLPNRVLAMDRLMQQINTSQRKGQLVAAVLLDLDDFKKVNDTLGHETGDRIIIEAASRLQRLVRSEDTVGRLGGDEFIILVSGLSHPGEVHPIVEGLLQVFQDPFILNGRELLLTASLGIAIYPDDGLKPSDLLRNADSAMYHSKETGRNTFSYFTDSMNRQVLRRFLLEEQMHGALERQEFRVVYQPQVRIGDERITGAEALLRWRNAALGDIQPDEFIPVAEHTGMIITLGKFVLREALRQVAVWQGQRPELHMAINLSPRQFRDPDLVPHIERTLQQSGVAATSLELEITEGVLMSGQSYIGDTLTRLRQLGVGIAMDDFGTGYSSLSYLRRYPFDILKIDRSFIQDLTFDPADRELINAIIAMARSLGLRTVAEGVEERAQVDHLAHQGCEYAQGYLFSRPLEAADFTALVDAIGSSGPNYLDAPEAEPLTPT